MAEPCAETVLVREPGPLGDRLDAVGAPAGVFSRAALYYSFPLSPHTREVEKPMNIQTCISAGSRVSLELLRA